MKIDLEILSTELLKPSKSTPPHLKCFKRSLLDQISPSIYVPVNLFYTNDAEHGLNIPKILTHLKNSLSDTLTSFYPFAGRLKDRVSIDCNDEGVIYREARARCHLSELLEKPDILLLGIFVPCKPLRVDTQTPSSPLLGVQVNVFQCGGIVIGVCFSHLIADAKSMSTFLKSWASTDKIIYPDFATATTVFPPRDHLPDGMSFSLGSSERGKFLMRRFVFDPKALERLRTEVATNRNPNPTRIQAISAFVWERVGMINTSKFPSLVLTVNLRQKSDPPLPDCSIGNLCWFAHARYESSEEGQSLPELAERVKKAFDSVDSRFIDYLKGDQGFEMMKSVLEVSESSRFEKTSHYSLTFTSWCNMGFYEVDFGWGKPVWVASAGLVEEPNTLLKFSGGGFYDAAPGSGGGIEAWLILPEEQMVVLENDPEFLGFASLNPGVLP